MSGEDPQGGSIEPPEDSSHERPDSSARTLVAQGETTETKRDRARGYIPQPNGRGRAARPKRNTQGGVAGVYGGRNPPIACLEPVGKARVGGWATRRVDGSPLHCVTLIRLGKYYFLVPSIKICSSDQSDTLYLA